MLDRRKFLLGTTAVVAAGALPFVPASGEVVVAHLPPLGAYLTYDQVIGWSAKLVCPGNGIFFNAENSDDPANCPGA